jgi:hypothetical protein
VSTRREAEEAGSEGWEGGEAAGRQERRERGEVQGWVRTHGGHGREAGRTYCTSLCHTCSIWVRKEQKGNGEDVHGICELESGITYEQTSRQKWSSNNDDTKTRFFVSATPPKPPASHPAQLTFFRFLSRHVNTPPLPPSTPIICSTSFLSILLVPIPAPAPARTGGSGTVPSSRSIPCFRNRSFRCCS